jgi:nucleotidyltransferase/DNA polymerase involved in DNA repair
MLPRVGIGNLEELVLRTHEKKEREELALRLLIPKEELIRWVEDAKLAQLKGLGIENLRLLEEVGIHSVTVLAGEDPDQLYDRMVQFRNHKPNLKKAKVRIWIREAQKKVKSYE